MESTSAAISQEEMIRLFIPYIKEHGKHYIKNKKIMARKAVEGEFIQTITDDGLETQNRAKQGDYVVRNLTEAGEEYIISGSKFQKRYRFDVSIEGAYDIYLSIGTVWGVEYDKNLMAKLKLGKQFYFVAPWGENMVVKENDYVVTQEDFAEVYRIARKEFFETYAPNGW